MASELITAVATATPEKAFGDLCAALQDTYPLLKPSDEKLAKMAYDPEAEPRLEESMKQLTDHLLLKSYPLKKLRNDGLPINRLGDYVLTRIFLEVLIWPYDNITGTLNTLASVCTKWFDIVVKEPRLWKVVNIRQREAANMVLQRNKEELINVRCRYTKHTTLEQREEFIKKAAETCHRWSRIYYSGDVTDSIVSSLEGATIQLSGLYITNKEENETRRVKLWEDGQPLVDVDLERISLPWDSPRLMGLQRLSLVRLNLGGAPPLSELWTMLICSPLLTHLILRLWSEYEAVDNAPAEEVKPEDHIHLPVLTHFELEGLPESVNTYLMARIKAPSCRTLSVKEPVPWKLVSFNPPSPFSEAVLSSVASSSRLRLTYKTGGKEFRIDNEPELSMKYDWLDDKKDGPGIYLAVNTEGAAESWFQDAGSALAASCIGRDSVALRIEADDITVVGTDANGDPIVTPQLSAETISGSFSYITRLDLCGYADVQSYFDHLGSRLPSKEWPCTSLSQVSCVNLTCPWKASGDLMGFALRRIRAANGTDGYGTVGPRPDHLMALYIPHVIFDLFGNHPAFQVMDLRTDNPV